MDHYSQVEKNSKSAIKLKGILTLSLTILALLLMLFMPLISFADNSIDLKETISGIKYLITSFDNKYCFYSEEFEETLTLGYNQTFSVLIWILFALIIALIVLEVIEYFIKKKSAEWISYVFFFTLSFALAIFLISIISNSLIVESLYGPVAFYKCYEIGISILVLLILCALGAILCKYIRPNNIIVVKKYLPLYFFLIIPFGFILIFCIYPIILQLVLSFKNYKMDSGVFQSDWIGLANFKKMFSDPTMLKMIGNTIYISLWRMFLGILPPLFLSIFLFDLGMPRYRKVVQTIIYIPHFFSWVIIFAIAYAFINQEGIINQVIKALGGKSIIFFNNDNALYPILFITDLWKELGWGTILFLAALSGINPTLYEAASIDGAGAMDKLFKITLPSIAPTIVFVSIMAIGNILKGAGGEQILLFGTDYMESAQTIDTWVIWQGIGNLQYGLSSAVSFIQSTIGLILVLICNHFSKKYTNMGIW